MKECFICETNRYEALSKDVWEKLEVSTSVALSCKDEKNKEREKVYVRIKLREEDDATKIVGSLSKEDSESIIKYVQKEWGEILYEAIICKADKVADENKRFSVAIYIKPHEA